jgi:hypothetical protein
MQSATELDFGDVSSALKRLHAGPLLIYLANTGCLPDRAKTPSDLFQVVSSRCKDPACRLQAKVITGIRQLKRVVPLRTSERI